MFMNLFKNIYQKKLQMTINVINVIKNVKYQNKHWLRNYLMFSYYTFKDLYFQWKLFKK